MEINKKIMNYKIVGWALIISFGFGACTKKLNVNKVFADAEQQTKVMLAEIPKAKAERSAVTTGATPGSAGTDLVSPRTLADGKLRLVTSRDWTSGFFPGVLWFLNEHTNKMNGKRKLKVILQTLKKRRQTVLHTTWVLRSIAASVQAIVLRMISTIKM